MDPGPDSTNPVAFSQDDPETIYLLTSLTAGSSSIITATSRLEHLLKSNKVPFKAVDLATDSKARGLWSRRGGGKRLPGVVKDGLVLGVRISSLTYCFPASFWGGGSLYYLSGSWGLNFMLPYNHPYLHPLPPFWKN